MIPALWVAKTGLDAQQTRMNVVANNLANVNTTGFKRDRAMFEDLLYQNVRQVGGQTSQNTTLPSGLMLGTGTRLVTTEKIHSQGNTVQTNQPLDLAIQGRGFFQIQRPDGSLAYSRDGSFKIDADGQVVTNEGYVLEPAINIPPGTSLSNVTVGVDGVVSAKDTTGATVNLGNLQLADFVNPVGLQPIGGNLYVETAASGPAQPGNPGQNGVGELKQGMLESSNVSVAEELVSMIETQRAYEINSKAIQASDQMLSYLNNNV